MDWPERILTTEQIESTVSNVLNIFNEITNKGKDFSLVLTKDDVLQNRGFLSGLIIAAPLEREVEILTSTNHFNGKIWYQILLGAKDHIGGF